jgi:hypothetical protein
MTDVLANLDALLNAFVEGHVATAAARTDASGMFPWNSRWPFSPAVWAG